MSFAGQFVRELSRAPLHNGPGSDAVVGEEELARLPRTVQRYLRFMGVVGRARDWSFRLGQMGRFRTSPEQPWMKCEAWQYNSAINVARIFQLKIRVAGVIPVVARDTYLNGEGRMLVKSLRVFNVADTSGPELDIGELVTYVNDALLYAPSMLLGPATRWTEVDDRSFDLAFTDRGHTVTARVLVDEKGALRDFSTLDRFLQLPEDPRGRLVRTLWTTPIDGWQPVEDRMIPTEGRAIWHLASGEFPYAELRPSARSLVFNLPPSTRPRPVVAPEEEQAG